MEPHAAWGIWEATINFYILSLHPILYPLLTTEFGEMEFTPYLSSISSSFPNWSSTIFGAWRLSIENSNVVDNVWWCPNTQPFNQDMFWCDPGNWMKSSRQIRPKINESLLGKIDKLQQECNECNVLRSKKWAKLEKYSSQFLWQNHDTLSFSLHNHSNVTSLKRSRSFSVQHLMLQKTLRSN